MKIISWNVNGIRAIERKGELQKFLKTHDPDIFLLQETKAHPDQLSEIIATYSDYTQFYHAADKAGYSGTGIWIKNPLSLDVTFDTGMDGFEENEGRISRMDIGDWIIFSVYFPNGQKSEEAWQGKLVFYEEFLQHINDLRLQGKKVLWGGDVNCAHEEIDLARPKENQNSIGFLPEERAWVSKVIGHNWIDVFRTLHPETVIYSWWHLISRARDRNVGWRIDYFFLDKSLLPLVQKIEYLNDQMGSDHCPVMIKVSIDI